MNSFVKFFHHLFTPHCELCHTQELENKECPSCDTLRQEINRLSQKNTLLLQAIITKNVPASESPASTVEIKPIQTNAMPFRVRRQMLEAESRAQKNILDERIKEIEKEVYRIPVEQLVPTPAPVTEVKFDDTTVEEKEAMNGL